MISAFLKIYYRPGTIIPVVFSIGYTEKKFRIISVLNGIVIDNIVLPVSALIEYEGKFTGEIKIGSEECRFRAGNSDFSCKMYLLAKFNSVLIVEQFVNTMKKKVNTSNLYLR